MQRSFGDKVTPRRHFARETEQLCQCSRPWAVDAPRKQAFPHHSDEQKQQIHSRENKLYWLIGWASVKAEAACKQHGDRENSDLKIECGVTFWSFVNRPDNRDGKLFDWWSLLMCLEIRLFSWQIIWVCFNFTPLRRHKFRVSKALDGDDNHGPAIQRVVALSTRHFLLWHERLESLKLPAAMEIKWETVTIRSAPDWLFCDNLWHFVCGTLESLYNWESQTREFMEILWQCSLKCSSKTWPKQLHIYLQDKGVKISS